jgi:6-phosphogluconolactonase (cycloisomerase 2 family)
MAMRVRAFLSLTVVAGTMWLAGCSHYNCGVTFGASTCSSTTPPPGTPSAFAYAVDQNGTMDGYAFSNSSGTFESISGYTAPPIGTNTGGVGVVVAQGKYLYAVIEDTQQIYGFQIGSSGSLTALSGFPVSISGLTGIANTGYNQQVVITNPAGTLLFIDQFILEQIFVYQISSTGALTAAQGSPFSTLGQTLEPQNMAMDGQGKYLYVAEDSADHSGAFIAGYSVSSTGVLTAIPNSFTWGHIPIWQMQGEPSGKYMIGISGKTAHYYGSDDDNIYVYAIDSPSGALSPVAGSPFATKYAPFNLTVQPTSTNGEYVYSFSINDTGTGSNPIEGFQLNASTGALTELTGSPFSSLTTPTAWGQFDPSGAYLFFYTGAAPNVSLGVLSVDKSGGLTAVASTVALKSSGYWAVSDVP